MVTKNGKAPSESHRDIKIIDDCRKVVATAKVVEEDKLFTGCIDLTLMPKNLLAKFEEYEEVVDNQIFSILDEIEEQIDDILLKIIFEEGDEETSIQEVQIYPSTKRISFKITQDAVETIPEEAAVLH